MMIVAARLYYASCVFVACVLLSKIVELGLSNAYYGFSAIWIAPKLVWWAVEQAEILWASSASLFEILEVPGSSVLCKSFANLFDHVRLGRCLNTMTVIDLRGNDLVYDYWSSQYKVYILVTAAQFTTAIWTPHVTICQWWKDARCLATDFQIIELSHIKSTWNKNEKESTTIRLRGKSLTQLIHFIRFANEVYGEDPNSADPHALRLRLSVPRTLTDPLLDEE
jgi:hypothetical protein